MSRSAPGSRRRGLLALCVLGLSAPFVFQAAVADHPSIGAQEPSAEEQDGIYDLNRARSDPEAYGNEIGLDLSTVVPRPPLAVNQNLTGGARFHAKEMLDHDYFKHVSDVTGIGPNQVAVNHGYDLFGNGPGFVWGVANTIESIAAAVNLIPTFPGALELLIVDAGVPGLGHRRHLLATSIQFAAHREVGMGRAASGKVRRYSILTGYVDAADLFITGVVYRDKNGNGRYDAKEGLAGAMVGTGGPTDTTTMAEGGYAMLVTPGVYNVTCSGGGLRNSPSAFVTVTDANVEVDCIDGVPLAEVDFEFQAAGPPAGPEQSKQQQKCISALNGGFAKVAAAKGKALLKCLKQTGKTGAFAEACMAAPDLKTDKVRAKIAASAAKSCTAPVPDFGATDAITAGAAAVGIGPGILDDVFGPNLDPVLESRLTDKFAAKCQLAVVKAGSKCEKTRLKEFNRCKKVGLKKETITDALALEACISSDPKGKVAKTCAPGLSKLGKVVAKTCEAKGVDLLTAFPGCGTADAMELAACFDDAIACRVCEAINAADGLAQDCGTCP